MHQPLSFCHSSERVEKNVASDKLCGLRESLVYITHWKHIHSRAVPYQGLRRGVHKPSESDVSSDTACGPGV